MDNNSLDPLGFLIKNTPEVKVDYELEELEQRFNKAFGYRMPREELPPSITNDDLKSAMKKCLEENSDKLFEILNIKTDDDALT